MEINLDQLLETLRRDEAVAEEALATASAKHEEIQKRRKSVELVLDMIDNPTPLLGLNGSTRYAGKGMTEAVLDCVNTFAGKKGLARGEVVELLQKHGFSFGGKPKNFYGNVSVTLRRLHRDQHEIDCIEGNGAMRFVPISTTD